MRFLIFLLILGGTLYLLSYFGKRQGLSLPDSGASKGNRMFRAKRNPGEVWVQVYETASLDEGRMLQARLQEEDMECILYEQGKKDIHGNPLKGVGIAVPKTATGQAQKVISRMLA